MYSSNRLVILIIPWKKNYTTVDTIKNIWYDYLPKSSPIISSPRHYLWRYYLVSALEINKILFWLLYLCLMSLVKTSLFIKDWSSPGRIIRSASELTKKALQTPPREQDTKEQVTFRLDIFLAVSHCESGSFLKAETVHLVHSTFKLWYTPYTFMNWLDK